MPDGQKLVPIERMEALQRMAAEGVPEGALFELPCSEMLQLLRHIQVFSRALTTEAGDYCLICGCTQHTPCTPPCSWAAEGLCSACRWHVTESDDGDGWIVVDRVSGKSVTGPVDAEVYDEDGEIDDCGGEVVWIKREDAEAKARELAAAPPAEGVPLPERTRDLVSAAWARLKSKYNDSAIEFLDRHVPDFEGDHTAANGAHVALVDLLAHAHAHGFEDAGPSAVAICVHCEAIATQADEDRCCLTCGADLVVCTDDVGAEALLSFLADERHYAEDDVAP